MKIKSLKGIVSCFLALLILIGTLPTISVSALAEITTDDGFVYKRFSGEIWITDYVGDAVELTVPNEIDGYPVVNFDSAFEDCTSIKEVMISDGIISIDGRAFSGCTNLKSVDIPDSVTNIGAFAFYDCSNLKDVIIPNGVISIEESAFSHCSSIESISIPETVVSVGPNAFWRCTALKSISLPSTVKYVFSDAFEDTAYYNDGTNWEDCVLYIGSILIDADDYMIRDHYTVKEGTTCIAFNAFDYCSDLTGITIPEGVVRISDHAFDGCRNLVEIDIPDSVIAIGNDAFYNTGYYNNHDNWENDNWEYNVLYIDTALYKVDDTYFADEFVVKDGTTCIADYAFNNCTGYKSITIPEGVRHIGDGAFGGCENLSTLYLPSSVASIGDFAFRGTNALTDIYFNGSESEWNSISVDYSALNNSLQNATIHFADDIPVIPSQPVSLTECTITLDNTVYTYDGTAKEPEVTVKHGSTTLLKDTDYTVSYIDNTKVGTATVTVKGIGAFTGTVIKEFTINEEEVKTTPITDCTVTLSKTSFTYDGKEKKPDVTVKYNTKTLVKDTDYTVSYSNNLNAGSATVTVTGIGNYTGTASRSFLIVNASTPFTWGQDNWNFDNSYTYFGRDTYRKQISAEYQNALKANLTNSEYQTVFEGSAYSYAWLDDTWGGSCYGMSSLTMLSKEGLFPYSSYKTGATALNDLNVPNKDAKLNSLITYYQMLQIKSVIQQQYRTVPYRTHSENIQNILTLLDSNSTVLLGFKKSGWGGHAILAYGYEYGSWSFNGVTYDGCIKICDPNASKAYDSDANIYFNTKTYNWAIPLYSYVPITSAAGAVFNYIGADLGQINEGGYLSGFSGNGAENYVARIDATAISENRTVSKVAESNGSYMNKNTAPGEIVEDYSYVLGGESEGTVGYTLFDSESAYRVAQPNPVELQLSMDYENCNMTGGSSAGSSVLFDNIGYVQVEGEAADFNISMTFDSDYPTDWFTMQVSGSGTNKASLEKVESGYVLSADNMENITVTANNKDTIATVSFSADYPQVFIYEIDVNTIGVSVDADNNGTYETNLFTGEQHILTGDVNTDGVVNVKDATTIQKHLASLITLESNALNVADYDADSKVTIKDATAIQKHIAGIK
ncbi:MAG: leucine-rich repeat protein [Ruminococcus sp.]|nr:leucine-rich repeat protein [Ruminococcus sp.]